VTYLKQCAINDGGDLSGVSGVMATLLIGREHRLVLHHDRRPRRQAAFLL